MPAIHKGDCIADRYEIIRVIGRGGMGMVYLVHDCKTQEELALKTLLPEYVTNQRAIQRFIQEVRTARRLDHPCIVKIYDAQQTRDYFFYTMEYVKGKTIREWMAKKKRFGLGSTVRVLSLLCYALEHAHRFTIHRDISPENVMVTPEGDVKLLDFGLAKLVDAQTSFTRIGVSLGKQHYSAPEQRANAKAADHRADLFSLGVLFYEMLGGRTPRPDTPLTQLAPNLPQECDTFVEKAIDPDTDARFQTAAEFRRALQHVYRIAQMSPEDLKAERARSNLDRGRRTDTRWRLLIVPLRLARDLLSRKS